MNPDTHNEAEAIRSDIDATRQRMDQTMDALGDRLQGRHLIDEILGLFRRSGADGKLSNMKDTISNSATSAMHGVVDTVKANPIPALLIGAGVGWMIYASRRGHESGSRWAEGGEMEGHLRYDPDVHYDRPLQYPAGETSGQFEFGAEDSSKLSGMGGMIGDKTAAAREKLGHAGERAKEKLSHAGERAKEKLSHVRERASALGGQAREKARAGYYQTRERVSTTAEQHPLELGLVCLAVGALVGLALPTPEPVNRVAGEAVDRLRHRSRETGREMMEKGKRVAHAATEAVKEEAEAQGLTADGLREKAKAVAEHTKDATTEAARQEGLPAGAGSKEGQENEGKSDPTFARRDM